MGATHTYRSEKEHHLRVVVVVSSFLVFNLDAHPVRSCAAMPLRPASSCAEEDTIAIGSCMDLQSFGWYGLLVADPIIPE